MQGQPRQMRDGWLQGIEAIVEPQHRMPPETMICGFPLDVARHSEMISPTFRFEVAHPFRDDVAHGSGMMSPG
ncbi:hypothetical protein [Bradyrhizobium sp. USDA 4529]